MEKLLIDYALSSTTVSNPDGTIPANVKDCSPIVGPGQTVMGLFPNALRLGPAGGIRASLAGLAANSSRFCIRMAFCTNGPVTGRQNLAESNHLPFAMFLDKDGSNPSQFRVLVSVAPTAHGWNGTNTQHITTLLQGQWYVADLVYDLDTLAVFINGSIVSVHAMPKGAIALNGNPDQRHLFIGTWIDGQGARLNGSVAGFQWYSGIPDALEAQLDERRSHPEWFISHKSMVLSATFNLGEKLGKYRYDAATAATIQDFSHGLVMYSTSIGAAFEMHGLIWAYYKDYTRKSELGHLVSDEIAAGTAGARKSLFQKGGIYWSGGTGARAVTGRMYLDYEGQGESRWIGLPNSEMQLVANGRQQGFQRATLFYKNNAARAFEVRGAILAKYLATGGVGRWGFPQSNENDVKRGNTIIGKCSQFELSEIYWSGSTGAFELHGDLLTRYKAMGGPLSELGFPTSDEADTPGAGGSRYNTFQKGSLVWYGNADSIQVCWPFQVFLGTINSKENEGLGMGQNDLYIHTSLSSNGHTLFSKRFPNTGDFGGRNIVNINSQFNHTITPNNPGLEVVVKFDIWDDDGITSNDHLGTYTQNLNIANAWGMRNNGGIFNVGSFAKINSITWSVKQMVNVALLSEPEKWWAGGNQGTPTLSRTQYATAFRDVDSETEWWDIGDHLHSLFYELVVKGIANGGNCFGMSTEGIYARKNRSLFSLPLNRFNQFSQYAKEVNIKQAFQVGADPIWWFVGQFVTGNTHSPVNVFREARAAFNRGDHPVICVAQNYDFSGAPHCILPVGFKDSVKPWEITILDPNIPNATRTLFVNPDKDEFTYTGTSSYKGGAWSGGRFHYMPYCILSSTPRTPLWDAILLILAGTIIILGEDASTQSIKDGNNVDLDALGNDATAKLKAGQRIDGKFLSVKGFDGKIIKKIIDPGVIANTFLKKGGKGIIPGEMLVSMQQPSGFKQSGFVIDRPGVVTLGNLLQDNIVATKLRGLGSQVGTMADRNLFKLAGDEALLKGLDRVTAKAVKDLAAGGLASGSIQHAIAGVKNGSLNYMMKGAMSMYQVISTINAAEVNNINTRQRGTDAMVVEMDSSRAKAMQLNVHNKLGIGDDQLRISIDKIALREKQVASFNLHQGSGGIDIVAGADRVNAEVTIESRIDGRKVQKRFPLPIEGGVRIQPATVLSGNDLLVGKIDKIYGQIRETTTIRSR